MTFFHLSVSVLLLPLDNHVKRKTLRLQALSSSSDFFRLPLRFTSIALKIQSPGLLPLRFICTQVLMLQIQHKTTRRIDEQTHFPSAKTLVFPVFMCRCERWTIKKAECRRTDTFELWHQRKLLRVPWAARRSNQSILKEISPGCSLEGMMLKLKLQYFGHLMQTVESLEKTLMLGGIGGRRRRGRPRMRWLDGIMD